MSAVDWTIGEGCLLGGRAGVLRRFVRETGLVEVAFDGVPDLLLTVRLDDLQKLPASAETGP